MQEKIWRCDCGGSHFVSIQKPFDDTPVLSIELYEVYRTFSDSSGLFSIYNVDPTDTGNYFIVALDPNIGYNALAYDRITPEVVS